MQHARKKAGKPKGSHNRLDPKHMAFVSGLAMGKTAIQAARDAGFKGKQSPHRLRTHPKIQQEIAKIHEKIIEKTAYDAKAMMAELDAAIAFAKETENANAYTKAVELKGKLHGLLIDRVDQRQVGTFSINIGGIDDEPKPPVPVIDVQAREALPAPDTDTSQRLADMFDEE